MWYFNTFAYMCHILEIMGSKTLYIYLKTILFYVCSIKQDMVYKEYTPPFLYRTFQYMKLTKYDTLFDTRRKMEEEWKNIRDWPDYKISNFGQVYSNRRNRLLKISPDRNGYPSVNLANNKVWKRVGVHILVAIEFVEGYFEGAEVNHKDGIKSNCSVSNLEWMTHQDNIRHAFALGLNPTRRIRWTKIR